MKIMLIEDDKFTRELVKATLEAFGYEITDVSCIEDALNEFLTNNKPDVIILDLKLATIDGKTFVDSLLPKIEEEKKIPIIVVTGYSDKETKEHLKTKVYRYLIKPVNIELLVSILEEIRTELNL